MKTLLTHECMIYKHRYNMYALRKYQYRKGIVSQILKIKSFNKEICQEVFQFHNMWCVTKNAVLGAM